MDEHPALALREKKDASILVATDLVRKGEADAVVTAGHTGAGMAAAVLRLGRLPGVDRPALAVQMITKSGPFVFLDIGANPDSSGENLYQYAEMGALFAEKVLGVERPRVAPAVDRGGARQGRCPDRSRDAAARSVRPQLRRATSRARTSSTISPTSSSAMRSSGTSSSSSSRGCRRSSSTSSPRSSGDSHADRSPMR